MVKDFDGPEDGDPGGNASIHEHCRHAAHRVARGGRI